jgi:hypothetical protein
LRRRSKRGIRFIFVADIFPAVAEKMDINLLAQFKEGTAAADLPAGSFDAAFPDLEASSKYLTEVPLEKLQLHFREESSRAAEKIDVSFLKFPADELAYVGSGLIFVLSFYACAVLRDFRLRVVPGDKAWDIAWIGISKEAWSIAIFWASMLLPLGTALLLFEKGLKIPPSGRRCFCSRRA